MAFSDSLQELRTKAHLTQEELSKRTGLSKSAIGMYEQGRRFPSEEVLELFADFFNVNMDTLLGKTKRSTYYLDPETAKLAQEVYDNPDLRILFDASRDLRPEDIKFVVDMINRMKRSDSHE